MIVFTERDRECARALYQDMADAIAAAIERRRTKASTVFVAAHQHRRGVELTAHATHAQAEASLTGVMVRKCARDPMLRDRVVERFGAWPAQQMHKDEVRKLAASWGSLADSESLWVSECAVDGGPHTATRTERRRHAQREESSPRQRDHVVATEREATRRLRPSTVARV